jgi:hypothetical protein
MRIRSLGSVVAAAALVLAGESGTALAARLRFHYGPGTSYASPYDAATAPRAERVSWFGTVCEPYNGRLPRPPCYITYRHPFTGAPITLPVALPEGTPRIEHRGRRLIYNYGSYTVEVQFLPDGSADVIYNAGPGRCP